jgi:hypothetical protein
VSAPAVETSLALLADELVAGIGHVFLVAQGNVSDKSTSRISHQRACTTPQILHPCCLTGCARGSGGWGTPSAKIVGWGLVRMACEKNPAPVRCGML